MKNERCAIGGEADREGRGAGGALTISRFRPFGRALLPWAAAAAMLFGGGLAAQAEPITPASPECTVSGTTVTCTGDLQRGVDVDAHSGPYTTLYVNKLDGNIAPVAGGKGIEFTFEADTNTDLDLNLTIDTGGFDIITRGDGGDGVSVDDTYNGSNIKIDVTGDIKTGDTSGHGIRTASDGTDDVGDHVLVIMNGNITTTGERSVGIRAASEGRVTVEMTGDIKTEHQQSGGIYANSFDGGDIEVTVTGNIETKGDGSEGIDIKAGQNGAVTVTVTGDIKTEGQNSTGINAEAAQGSIGITLNGGTINAGADGVKFVGGPTGTGVFNTLTINNAVTISGASGDVVGGTGDEIIDNYGTLTTRGTIDLGAEANFFNNMAGATFNSGTAVILGPNDRFTNEGDLSPGGASACGAWRNPLAEACGPSISAPVIKPLTYRDAVARLKVQSRRFTPRKRDWTARTE